MGPYADSLLPLKSVEYINASPIDNIGDGAPWFVATMCPKRETFAHFWSMVWELGTRVIVNLTHERDRVGSGPNFSRSSCTRNTTSRQSDCPYLHGNII